MEILHVLPMPLGPVIVSHLFKLEVQLEKRIVSAKSWMKVHSIL